VPLYSLYELAILAIRLTHWRRSRKEAASAKAGSAS
jgi:Sec-independent protein secretion pathway component TatC